MDIAYVKSLCNNPMDHRLTYKKHNLYVKKLSSSLDF